MFPTEPTLAVQVREALGMTFPTVRPIAEHGETDTRVSMWTQRELSEVYERVGGTVTARTVQRSSSDGTTWQATEITVTVDLPGIGPVEAFTDWDEQTGGRDLPVVRALGPDVGLIAD